MELNRFMLGYTSICPETTRQILESQRVYLFLKTMDLYVMFSVIIHVGVASARLLFSGKLSKLRLSFLLCKYMTYRRIIWQSTDHFNFQSENAIF